MLKVDQTLSAVGSVLNNVSGGRKLSLWYFVPGLLKSNTKHSGSNWPGNTLSCIIMASLSTSRLGNSRKMKTTTQAIDLKVLW